MAEKLQFELVSPEKLLLSEAVAMVVVPGGDGNFGVLPGHALFISTVRPGVIDVYADEQNQVSERIFVSGGFAEVTPERCTVLADEAVSPDSLDRGSIEADLRIVEGNLPSLREQVARAAADTGRERLLIELRRLEREQAVLQAKLQALGETTH
jgi:F-type H+-transporting ATPase subunit epsilon